jgi:hypothetical protein
MTIDVGSSGSSASKAWTRGFIESTGMLLQKLAEGQER